MELQRAMILVRLFNISETASGTLFKPWQLLRPSQWYKVPHVAAGNWDSKKIQCILLAGCCDSLNTCYLWGQSIRVGSSYVKHGWQLHDALMGMGHIGVKTLFIAINSITTETRLIMYETHEIRVQLLMRGCSIYYEGSQVLHKTIIKAPAIIQP